MNQWEAIVEANPDEGLAFVMCKMGRFHLFVAGVVVATQGDVCRDPEIDDHIWTDQSLEQAAQRINLLHKTLPLKSKRGWPRKE